MNREVPAADFSWGTGDAFETIEDVRRACRGAEGHDPLDEAAELDLKHRGLANARLMLAGNAGFALIRDGELSLAVHPRRRREGLGGALAAAVADQTVSAWSHGDHPGARRLAHRHGLSPTRELWVMRRPFTTRLPEIPQRSGIEVRGCRQDAAELLRINAAAFADHPEQGAMSRADLAERMAEDWFDPAGLLVAEAEGGLVGFHWTKRHDARRGEVYVVGIDPAAQGRGLGSLLTLAGLHHLDDGQTDEVVLYVESDNLPARAVYERLGFTHDAADTHVHFTRPPVR